MSVSAKTWATKQRIADQTLKEVLRELAWRARDHNECWPSQAAIAEACGMGERTVRRALALLEWLEIISREPRSNGKTGRTSDKIKVAVGREINLSKADIQAARQAMAAASRGRRSEKLQPAPECFATGHRGQGYDSGTTYPPNQGGRGTDLGGRALTREEGHQRRAVANGQDWYDGGATF